MKCPVDEIDLVMSERSGIEVDYCPKCRGVWLDRGELDKIVERALASESSSGVQGRPDQESQVYGDHDHGRGHGHGRGYANTRGHRRRSWLSEIFD